MYVQRYVYTFMHTSLWLLLLYPCMLSFLVDMNNNQWLTCTVNIIVCTFELLTTHHTSVVTGEGHRLGRICAVEDMYV